MKVVVTGGRGFIASHFVESCLEQGHKVIDIDWMTYAANKTLPWDSDPNYTLIVEDIASIKHLPECDVVYNFAAESHVDNSITSPQIFLHSNVNGVFNLLDLIRGKPSYQRPLFFHISTDEVYGDIISGSFTEQNLLSPSNPYSASKASAEMLVHAYSRTYGIEYLISRCSNNYGERQYKEKLIPKIISCITNGKKIPVHGDGTYVRNWIYAKDHAEAINFMTENCERNRVYNISTQTDMTNIEAISKVLSWMNITGDTTDFCDFVENRWGQDLRYSISSNRLRNLGWTPEHDTDFYKWF